MITLTDLFCGAGGSSTGAIQVPGVTVRVASNHWKLAVDTHEANHPDTGHVCADLSQIDPRFYPRTEVLWGSPECTNHSIAKGGKKDREPDLFNQIPDEAAERSRATMWDIPRFTEVHRYQVVIVENVVDVARWAPYAAWLQAMDSLGYHHEVVYMNSMHAWTLGDAAPQSRDRFYAVFWRKGNARPDLNAIQRPPAMCPEHGRVEAIKLWKNPRRWGRFRSQYTFRCPHVACRGREVTPDWRPAASIIDWSDLGGRIGDRSRPLAEKTLRRIQAGIDRYWSGGVSDPLLVPVEGREGKVAAPVGLPYRTQTARNETALLTPFIAELRGGSSDARSVVQPLATVTASGTHHGVVSSRTPRLEDCHFRMLSPGEIKQAMAFPESYRILGTKRDQVRMAGNAVTPPAARDLIGACAQSLGVA